MKRVFSADIATQTGWQSHAPSVDAKPVCGSFKISHEGDDLGAAYVEFEQNLMDLISVHQPDVFSFEAPVPRGGRSASSAPSSMASVRKLLGLAAIAELVATRAGLEVYEGHIQQTRAHFTGNGNADKDAVYKMCCMLGWRPQNYDESDAAALWSHTNSIVNPKYQVASTPLFAGVRA